MDNVAAVGVDKIGKFGNESFLVRAGNEQGGGGRCH
jgi:hypothetical protein